ncbi:MAG: ferritin [Campylobacterales bacterium]
MLSTKIEKLLCEQLNREFFSSYLYLAMSAHCANIDMNGAASWFRAQYEEEVMHGEKVFGYLMSQGAKVEFDAIDKPKSEFGSLLETFQESLDHERHMTEMINELSDVALKEKDHATYNLLQWFVTEQVEEEATVSEIISKLKIVKNDGYGLLMIDNELGARQPANVTNIPQA